MSSDPARPTFGPCLCHWVGPNYDNAVSALNLTSREDVDVSKTGPNQPHPIHEPAASPPSSRERLRKSHPHDPA